MSKNRIFIEVSCIFFCINFGIFYVAYWFFHLNCVNCSPENAEYGEFRPDADDEQLSSSIS